MTSDAMRRRVPFGTKGTPRRTVLQGIALLATAAAAPAGIRSARAQTAAEAGASAAAPKSESKTMMAYVGSRTTRERNARGEGISVYKVDAPSGDWIQVQLVRDLVNPSFLAFDRSKRFLYTVHGDGTEVTSFAIAENGHLRLLNRQPTGGSNPVHLVADPSNKVLTVANYATGNLGVLPINPDGSLGELTQTIELPGAVGPHRVEQTRSHPHHVPLDPAERFIVVPDKALDRVFVFRIEAGKLVANDPPSVKAREGAGPRHISFHPSKPFAYVINELDSTVTTYSWDPQTGVLKPLQILPSLPSSYTGDNRAAGIEVGRSGRFVYTSNRGHDSIAMFAVNDATGLLSSVGWQPTQGRMPRFFAIDPSGSFLHAANEATDTIVSFRVDPETGTLSPTGQVVKTGSPVCIVFGQV